MFQRLSKFFKSSESKVDANRYFEICEQLGQEPDPERIPVEWADLPAVAHDAINIFNTLGDRIVVDIGYLGKDYSNLSVLIDAYKIEDPMLLLDILHWLDERAIKRSQEQMKRERDKLKNKK